MLDGVEIKTLNLKWLRKQMGLVGPDPCPSYPSSPNPNPYPYLTSDPTPTPDQVGQEPVLFEGTVAENIQVRVGPNLNPKP